MACLKCASLYNATARLRGNCTVSLGRVELPLPPFLAPFGSTVTSTSVLDTGYLVHQCSSVSVLSATGLLPELGSPTGYVIRECFNNLVPSADKLLKPIST